MNIDKIITNGRMDRFIDTTDRWSRILAWVAVIAAFITIILPALSSLPTFWD